ncbi:hypothetical protein B0H66DRAFT_466961 [Apodospora peruviana]|uniref:DUF8035 domain-containing protein n=1 Tax=Apodospora peruviana TaxID=516989 RepID=A0AAE0IT19_9PEZI|nr:hypothetical protein B0H66DRAFT_466961 [Apodospora peruviana]
MADPGRYRYPSEEQNRSERRSPPLYNLARASLPVTTSAGGYGSLYGGDIHVVPTSHHETLASRPAADYDYDYRSSAVPVSTTTYAVRKDPIARSTSVKESGSRSHRSATIDSASKRPIIITTKHAGGAQSPPARAGSPSRDPYRSSDEGQYYAQPASSINRTRSSARAPFSAAMDNDEYRRLRERTELPGPRAAADPYRPPRPSVVYSNTHKPHRGDTMEYDDDGYEYTKPSDLARYDLDHDRHDRPSYRNRRDSYDRYYQRPTVSLTTEIDRPYESNDRRQRGPPPTTWGLDKVNRTPAAGLYDGAGSRMPVPPAVPLPPEARRSALLDIPGNVPVDRRTTSRPRPVSLIEDSPSRPLHHDDYYRSREEDLVNRQLHEQAHDYIKDDKVTSRGFGIRIEPEKVIERRRLPEPAYRDDRRVERRDDYQYDELEPRRSDDDPDYNKRRDPEDHNRKSRRDHDVKTDDDFVRDRKDKLKERSPHDDDERNRKDKLRDKVAAGLGVAAASIGLGTVALRDRDDKEKDEKDKNPEIERHRSDEADTRPKQTRKEPHLSDEDFEIIDLPKDPKDREPHPKDAPVEPDTDARHHHRDGAEAKHGDESAAARPRDHSSSTDDGKAEEKSEGRTLGRRRKRAPSAFNPNDPAALAEIKAKLAATEAEAKPAERPREIPVVKEPSPERGRTDSPPGKLDTEADSDYGVMVLRERDDSRGRELMPPLREEKQVRVVSPPREKDEKKPIKGILKQPKPQFPEEPNPIREGVAPHKDDKTKANVPPGARWTKINRKMVNPEALTIGKERFEVRDDFVIVLRVLSKEEIQAYADATVQLRGGLLSLLTFVIVKSSRW